MITQSTYVSFISRRFLSTFHLSKRYIHMTTSFRSSIRQSSSLSTTPATSPPLTSSSSSLTKQHSTNTSIRRVADLPPIAVDSWVAICDGDIAGSEHPREYIHLKKLNFHEPSACKYCGMRYFRKGSSDFAHAHE